MEIKDILVNQLPFWLKLNSDEQDYLISNSNKHTYSKNEIVHSGSSDCLGIILVLKGTLRTYMISEEGKEITLFRMIKNEACVLSASCIMDDVTFDVNIDAEVDTDVIIINNEAFQKLADSNPLVENFLYKTMIERFSQVMWVMEQILFMSMDKRMAIFLLDEGPEVKMTHEQIAKYMGTAREVVSRMLKYFADEGLVTLSRGKVSILNRKALMSYIN